MKVETFTRLLSSTRSWSYMNEDMKWAKCLEILQINSVDQLSISLVKKMQEQDPQNSRHYRDAYWYLKDWQNPPSLQRQIELKVEAEQKETAREAGAPRWFPPDTPDGDWGRPVDVTDTVGQEKSRNPEFAEQVEKNLAPDSIDHVSRFSRGR